MRLFKKRRKDREDPIQLEESEIIRRCIQSGDVVFDVGAHHGAWSEAVLKHQTRAELHVFEASGASHIEVADRLSDRAQVNHLAVSNHVGETTFHTCRDDARLSSIYRPKNAEEQIPPSGYAEETVPCTSLDAYWGDERRQINFLKLDVKGAEYDALRGANRLLRRGQIDYIQFEYGGTFQDAGVTLENVWSLLRRAGYRMFLVKGPKFSELKTFQKSDETYQFSNVLAVHGRLAPMFAGEPGDITLRTDEIVRHGIEPRGVLRVGAHQGQEVDAFRKLGLSPIVLVEADPALAQGLRDTYSDDSNIIVIEGAASDRDGTAEFNLASSDQPGLPVASTMPEEKTTVQTFRLDKALADAGVDASRLNLVVMDNQGAELKALRGASDLLQHVDAIQLGVCYDAPTDGRALIYDIDDFLAEAGMERVLTMTPDCRERGDGLYVRRPMVTDSRLGEMGRFANQVYQYMFLRCYAEEHGYDFANPPWIGDQLFHVQPGTPDVAKMAFSVEQQGLRLNDCNIANAPVTFPNTDILGYFQYDMRYYAPYKDIVLQDLAWRAPYAARAAQIRAAFDAAPGPVAAIHLRRGDYGYKYFFITPNEWYVDWLRDLRTEHPDLSVYIATDDPEAAATDFAEFNVISATDLGLSDHEPEFFADFTALSCADYVGVANSSFSFLASLLNGQAQGFARPSLLERKMIPFDPWTSEPLLYDTTAEKAGDEFMSDKEKSRSKHRIRKFFRGRK
ncbi:FkbM family methyltransferase [Falsiphaeobacter marinintestinus]|uniref:FkbM family methyltransferase n=1 Tax=Falsiphaeobacter marinintestinus TaxID=1492905 RepID=UPI0011B46AAD|nr:FkbM family methyltransferase [Phaeobacter marinintestinus]